MLAASSLARRFPQVCRGELMYLCSRWRSIANLRGRSARLRLDRTVFPRRSAANPACEATAARSSGACRYATLNPIHYIPVYSAVCPL